MYAKQKNREREREKNIELVYVLMRNKFYCMLLCIYFKINIFYSCMLHLVNLVLNFIWLLNLSYFTYYMRINVLCNFKFD